MSKNPNKKSYKVKKFKSEWLQETFDNVKVSSWLVADPSDNKKGKCIVCPPPPDSPFSGRSFSIAEGVSAIKKHSKNKTHLKAIEKYNNNEEEQDVSEQMRITQALKNQEEISKKDRKEQDAILQGQITFANICCISMAYPVPSSHVLQRWLQPSSLTARLLRSGLLVGSMAFGEQKLTIFLLMGSILINFSNLYQHSGRASSL